MALPSFFLTPLQVIQIVQISATTAKFFDFSFPPHQLRTGSSEEWWQTWVPNRPKAYKKLDSEKSELEATLIGVNWIIRN